MLTDPAVELLALAFAADPLYRWLFADRATRHAALRANFVLAVEAAQHAGHLDRAAGGDAVALWTEPGRALFDDPTPFLDLLEEFAPSRRDQALDAMARCGSLRPADAAVLHVVGVHPRRTGSGLGTALLSTRLERFDRVGVPVFLESSNPRNDAFYRRLGFDSVAAVRVVEGGPVVTAMLRSPTAPGEATPAGGRIIARGRIARCS